MKEVYIYDALRTPIGRGDTTGALYEVKPIDLLATGLKAIEKRNNLKTDLVDDVIVGCVTPVADQGANIAKISALYAGWHHSVTGLQINRFSGSGLEAVHLAAMKIRSGWENIVVAGGLECMSRVPIGGDGGPLMFDPKVRATIGFVPHSVSADLIATKQGFSRIDLDEYALLSYQRACHAQAQGYFEKSIVPVLDNNGLVILDKDEYLSCTLTMESLTALSPIHVAAHTQGHANIALEKYPTIEHIQHLHTSGNTRGVADGASLLLLADEAFEQTNNRTPRAKIVAIAATGSEPTITLDSAALATQKALKKANLKPSDIDLWEINEPFAAPVLKFQKDFDIPIEQLNVNGGGIAMGHPSGAIGPILLGQLLDELERRDLKRGLVAMNVGAGMGLATVIERG